MRLRASAISNIDETSAADALDIVKNLLLSGAILNLAEGNSRRSSKERARFFDISIASISEVSSALDIISAFGYIPIEMEDEFKLKLKRSYGMIISLRKSIL